MELGDEERLYVRRTHPLLPGSEDEGRNCEAEDGE